MVYLMLASPEHHLASILSPGAEALPRVDAVASEEVTPPVSEPALRPATVDALRRSGEHCREPAVMDPTLPGGQLTSTDPAGEPGPLRTPSRNGSYLLPAELAVLLSRRRLLLVARQR